MLWVNPRPQVPVKALRFTNPEGKTCPILIAVTAAIKRNAQEAAAARAKAQEVLAQAQQALDANQTDAAKKLLRQAVDLDAQSWSAYEKLADLAERGGRDDEKLAVYRAWTTAAAPTPLPFNRLGELLERRKDFKGALEAYTQSLRVEWNQPPIIEAKSRLERTLAR
jgi:tetratricopeptide (TPR) repeat protein